MGLFSNVNKERLTREAGHFILLGDKVNEIRIGEEFQIRKSQSVTQIFVILILPEYYFTSMVVISICEYKGYAVSGIIVIHKV